MRSGIDFIFSLNRNIFSNEKGQRRSGCSYYIVLPRIGNKPILAEQSDLWKPFISQTWSPHSVIFKIKSMKESSIAV